MLQVNAETVTTREDEVSKSETALIVREAALAERKKTA